jgi:Domain of unknown function (DUF1802)/Restriction endonuclease
MRRMSLSGLKQIYSQQGFKMATSSYAIANALRISPINLDLIAQGRTIAVFPWTFMSPGQAFALATEEPNRKNLANYWARCDSCRSIYKEEDIQSLQQITPWNQEIIEHHFTKKQFVFVALLRAYCLPIKIEIPENCLGDFYSLKEQIIVNTTQPVISDHIFKKRKQQLETLSPSKYPNLESLQKKLNQLSNLDFNTNSFDHDLQVFLEWEQPSPNIEYPADDSWIHRICEIGNSSDGNEFEKLVRKSFLQLGFTNSLDNIKASLDPNSTGGAGGIDIYCNYPFSLVGECKASKNESVPNSVSAQLIHLGTTHLGTDVFNHSVKMIFAAGSLTSAAQQAAVQNKMNVMTPNTLQRLIRLKVRYPGSIDLRELEQCLRKEPYGQDSDSKVNTYIDSIEQRIKNLSHIVDSLKKYLELQGCQEIGIDKFHVVFELSHPPQKYSEKELYNVLIELSSPLSGYLGRTQGSDWRGDRFYYLRDLIL